MAVTLEPGGSISVDVDAAIGEISRDVQAAMEAAAKVALIGIRKSWYGVAPGTPRDHFSGRPTQSTGESAAGWSILKSDFSGGHARVEIGNNVDYAQFVHPSGEHGPNHGTEGFGESGNLGESAGFAEEQFNEVMTGLEETLVRIATDRIKEI